MIRLPDDFLEPTDEDKEMSAIWKELRKNMEQTIEDLEEKYLIDPDSWFLPNKDKSDVIWHDIPHLRWEMIEGLNEMYPYLRFGWIHNRFPLSLFAQEAYA